MLIARQGGVFQFVPRLSFNAGCKRRCPGEPRSEFISEKLPREKEGGCMSTMLVLLHRTR